MTRLSGLCLLFCLALALHARAAEPVTFATDWRAQAEQGGFYQALATGLYAKRGLDVRIRQGGPQSNNPSLIAAGVVDLALGSNSFVVLNFIRAGAPVKAVMASFQKDPQVLICHPRPDIHGIADMKGKPIMIGLDSRSAFWPWLKRKYGFSDDQIRPYTFNMAPFLVDPKAIQEGYLGSEPYQIAKAGSETPQVYLLADNGYLSYGAMVVARDGLIAAKPWVVQAFVDATIEGWKSYLHGDPSPGNALIKADNPDMTDDLLAYGLAAMKTHGIVDSGDGLGAMTDQRWQSFARQAVELGLFPADLDVKRGYSLRFLHP